MAASSGAVARAVSAITAALLLIGLAAFAPRDSSDDATTSSDTEPLRADAAAILPAGESITSPPLEQPTIELPVPGPGEKPTQVVVVSIDGGCETREGTIQKLLDAGAPHHARMTFFLAGLCLLPDAYSEQYDPPNGPPGYADLPFADETMVKRRIEVFDRMYRAGHEIATHFLGHFCGDDDGVGTWSTADWTSELDQSKHFLDNWADYNPQAVGAPTLPFDSSTFVGARTPCLLGERPAMHKAFADAGLRYEASDPGVLQWPKRDAKSDLWLFPLPALKLTGTEKWVLSMDYNLMVNQTDGELEGSAETCKRVEEQTYQTFMDGLAAVYNGNRAPLVVGSHLNDWLCGAYITSMTRFIADASEQYPDVKFISFRDLADWLERMPADVLEELQAEQPQRY
jgi:peptidoglycan/xylan/chitin deacetylase (PgdA/CDA1 family)